METEGNFREQMEEPSSMLRDLEPPTPIPVPAVAADTLPSRHIAPQPRHSAVSAPGRPASPPGHHHSLRGLEGLFPRA